MGAETFQLQSLAKSAAPQNSVRILAPLHCRDLSVPCYSKIWFSVRHDCGTSGDNTFSLGDNDGAVFKFAMSFGFSVSNFITVLPLAINIRKFVDVPNQFKAISDACVIQSERLLTQPNKIRTFNIDKIRQGSRYHPFSRYGLCTT